MKFYVRFKNGDLISEHKTIEDAALAADAYAEEDIFNDCYERDSYELFCGDADAESFVALKSGERLTDHDCLRWIKDGFFLSADEVLGDFTADREYILPYSYLEYNIFYNTFCPGDKVYGFIFS